MTIYLERWSFKGYTWLYTSIYLSCVDEIWVRWMKFELCGICYIYASHVEKSRILWNHPPWSRDVPHLITILVYKDKYTYIFKFSTQHFLFFVFSIFFQHNTIQHHPTQHNTIRHNPTLYYIILHYPTQHYTILHYTT